MEVNPRIWGWLSLSMQAGIDIPFIAYADLVAETYHPGEAIEGAKWIHLATDLPTAFEEIFHGRLTIREYIRSIRGSRDAVFSPDDPIPFIVELCLIPMIAKRRGF